MCAPFSQNDELPDLPEPEAALKRLFDAELVRLQVAMDLEHGRVVHRHACRDVAARIVRLTAEVDRCRWEYEQALTAQARGEGFIKRPSSGLIVEAMQARQRQNVSLQSIEDRAKREPSVLFAEV